MIETTIRTHPIITDIQEQYAVQWCGKIKDTKPVFKNNKPIFIVQSDEGSYTLNTSDMTYLEKFAKKITHPHGRTAVNSETARIFIKEEDNKKTLIGKVIHTQVKKYVPMYDKVYYD